MTTESLVEDGRAGDAALRFDRSIVALTSEATGEFSARLHDVESAAESLMLTVGTAVGINVVHLDPHRVRSNVHVGLLSSILLDRPSVGLARHIIQTFGRGQAVPFANPIADRDVGMPDMAVRITTVDRAAGRLRQHDPIDDIAVVLDAHAELHQICAALDVSDTTYRSWRDGRSHPSVARRHRVDAVAEVCRAVRSTLDPAQWGEFLVQYDHPPFGSTVLEAMARDPIGIRNAFRDVFGDEEHG